MSDLINAFHGFPKAKTMDILSADLRCMHVCMYVCMYVCLHVTCTNSCLCFIKCMFCIHPNIYVSCGMWVCCKRNSQTWPHAHVHYTHIRTHACAYIHYIHTYITLHTYISGIYIYIHTHNGVCVQLACSRIPSHVIMLLWLKGFDMFDLSDG
jgi:hypothetical protein